MALLENVTGLLRVWNKAPCFNKVFWNTFLLRLGNLLHLQFATSNETTLCTVQYLELIQVWKCLMKLKGYYIGKLVIDPIYLGDAAKRRRIYILLIRRDVARDGVVSHTALQNGLDKTLSLLQLEGKCFPEPFLGLCFFNRFQHAQLKRPCRRFLMFPDDHPEVQRDIEARKKKMARAGQQSNSTWDMQSRFLGLVSRIFFSPLLYTFCLLGILGSQFQSST